MDSRTLAALLSKHTVSVMDYAVGMDRPRTKGYISLELVDDLAAALEAESIYCTCCGSSHELACEVWPFFGEPS